MVKIVFYRFISSVIPLKSVPLGMYCLMSPFVFSLAPRSQEWYG